ncbi:MAG TPA: hypothetical protein PKH69_09925 [Thiobacillaceae bacterium]|nr:hypothetical protein [Thiobacillaceae bacterium]HNU64793.1 hypothetical protein [Thiobacillaceae bacterium]
MKAGLIRLLPLPILAVVAYFLWQGPERGRPDPGASRTPVCTDLRHGCRIDLQGRTVRLVMTGEPKPLQAFQVRVHAPGARRVEARFRMEGMDMGFNLYTLRADAAGMFQAWVTLPVCVSGRRDWVMDLDVDGHHVAVPFVTDPQAVR